MRRAWLVVFATIWSLSLAQILRKDLGCEGECTRQFILCFHNVRNNCVGGCKHLQEIQSGTRQTVDQDTCYRTCESYQLREKCFPDAQRCFQNCSSEISNALSSLNERFLVEKLSENEKFFTPLVAQCLSVPAPCAHFQVEVDDESGPIAVPSRIASLSRCQGWAKGFYDSCTWMCDRSAGNKGRIERTRLPSHLRNPGEEPLSLEESIMVWSSDAEADAGVVCRLRCQGRYNTLLGSCEAKFGAGGAAACLDQCQVDKARATEKCRQLLDTCMEQCQAGGGQQCPAVCAEKHSACMEDMRTEGLQCDRHCKTLSRRTMQGFASIEDARREDEMAAAAEEGDVAPGSEE
ncbi:hypothetical protein PAPYR_1526 [Paratrimastix pyriformis]|uniref:VDE lipocalin domain-containing protein n=1 Tax=Paratrimastix pyriformis TaxID=342808 RepID=A0ABQ8URT4_9EUKA|nr:hypothetical protein PAPYR_1526 [Paratrimastix pyriformis]